jgi:hypothetical protein
VIPIFCFVIVWFHSFSAACILLAWYHPPCPQDSLQARVIDGKTECVLASLPSIHRRPEDCHVPLNRLARDAPQVRNKTSIQSEGAQYSTVKGSTFHLQLNAPVQSDLPSSVAPMPPYLLVRQARPIRNTRHAAGMPEDISHISNLPRLPERFGHLKVEAVLLDQ